MTAPADTSLDLTSLRAAVQGAVLVPGDADYDQARRVMSGMYDRRPAVVVRAAGVGDVQHVVRLAHETGLELAVRSGGHSAAGHSTTDAGIVLDLRDMKGLELDVEGRTAWAETGLTAGEYTVAAAEHGLATGFGDTASVGLGGITLGGGVGYLVRKHGLTIDNLLAAEVVTADGELLRVDDSSHPELFWAIRGGGGNFGVVTRLRLQLHPVDTVVGGMLVLPATAATVAGFVAAAESASEDLSVIANVMNCPPMPFVDAAHHGRVVILALVCWSGDPQAGDAALAPFRALATPLADLLRPMGYPELYPPDDPDYRPTAVSKTMFTRAVDEATAAALVGHLEASDAAMRVAQLRVLGGAMARVAPDATAFAHRSSRIMVNVAAFYDGEDDRVRREAWVDEVMAGLHQGDDGVYVNFLGDEGPERLRAAYPGATWDRLAAVKAQYDPGNLFRRNHNIPPASRDVPGPRHG